MTQSSTLQYYSITVLQYYQIQSLQHDFIGTDRSTTRDITLGGGFYFDRLPGALICIDLAFFFFFF